MVEESKLGGPKKFTKKEKQEHFKEKKREAAAKRKEEAKSKQKEYPAQNKKDKYDKHDRYEGEGKEFFIQPSMFCFCLGLFLKPLKI